MAAVKKCDAKPPLSKSRNLKGLRKEKFQTLPMPDPQCKNRELLESIQTSLQNPVNEEKPKMFKSSLQGSNIMTVGNNKHLEDIAEQWPWGVKQQPAP